MKDDIFPAELFRPWAENQLQTRSDVEAALKAIVSPVERFRSDGGARIRLDSAAAHFDQQSAEMEGFSRLLWGLAPAQAGGADWIEWEPIARGVANGCDPDHPEYWGPCFDHSQRLVELAAIGFALRLVPDRLWSPLSEDQKANVASYLLEGHACKFVDNNWQFFRLLISMGLRHVGVPVDVELDCQARDRIEAFYLGDGWYRDGNFPRADHYIPFAFHYYAMILTALDDGPDREIFRDRAAQIAGDICHWFADDGAGLCYGRSMTYRFAIAGFFGGLGVIGDGTIPAGQQKGFYLRNLRWWSKQPFAARDGIMPVGYGYPNLMMSENYNSGQSPLWALKAFLPLMLPESDPFWSAPEEVAPTRKTPVAMPHIGFVVAHPDGDAIALSSGQEAPHADFIRFSAEKYAKFAYSARHGFCIEGEAGKYSAAILDNMIGFSDDGRHIRRRESSEEALIADDVLYSLWRPYADVTVESWIYWQGDHHIRIHCVDTPRSLQTIEGGFAIAAREGLQMHDKAGHASVANEEFTSSVWDIGERSGRKGRCLMAMPNTNLVSAKTVLPQLTGEIAPGISYLGIAVAVGRSDAGPPHGTYDLKAATASLKKHFSERGRPISLRRK